MQQRLRTQILQISDRFHLLKDLTEACGCVIRRLFRSNIAVEKPGADVPAKPSEYNSTYWEKSMKKDAPERSHEKAVAKKKVLVRQVHQLAQQGLNLSEIARQTGMSWTTVKKYLQGDYCLESGGYGQKRPDRLKPYEDKIKEMLCRRCSFKEIEKESRQEGYTGATSTIRMYATRERRLMGQASGGSTKADIPERKRLLKLLYKLMEELQGIDEELAGRLIKEYPIVQDIHDMVESFREILFSKKAEDIDSWLAEVDRLEIDELISFANGLRKDLDAVKNAARYDHNNGLAEGSVNKLKLAKRKMYGRCSFGTLRKKVLLRKQYKIIQ